MEADIVCIGVYVCRYCYSTTLFIHLFICIPV